MSTASDDAATPVADDPHTWAQSAEPPLAHAYALSPRDSGQWPASHSAVAVVQADEDGSAGLHLFCKTFFFHLLSRTSQRLLCII